MLLTNSLISSTVWIDSVKLTALENNYNSRVLLHSSRAYLGKNMYSSQRRETIHVCQFISIQTVPYLKKSTI